MPKVVLNVRCLFEASVYGRQKRNATTPDLLARRLTDHARSDELNMIR